MKIIKLTGSLIALSLLVTTASLYAQRFHHYRYLYDASKEATVSGEIISVDSVARAWGNDAGTHLLIKTESGNLTVFLGPSSFLKDKISFAKGDRIEVTGARVDDGGRPGIVAREVKKGSVAVQLRNKDGSPLWAGRGWRHRR